MHVVNSNIFMVILSKIGHHPTLRVISQRYIIKVCP